MLTKREKILKVERVFLKNLKTSGRMTHGNQELKFEKNPHDGFRFKCIPENRRRTMYGPLTNFDAMTSADIV